MARFLLFCILVACIAAAIEGIPANNHPVVEQRAREAQARHAREELCRFTKAEVRKLGTLDDLETWEVACE